MKNTQDDNGSQLAPVTGYAADWLVHTVNGPVPACERHANAIAGLMAFMGAHTNRTPALAGEQCSNCKNERHIARVRDGEPETL